MFLAGTWNAVSHYVTETIRILVRLPLTCGAVSETLAVLATVFEDAVVTQVVLGLVL